MVPWVLLGGIVCALFYAGFLLCKYPTKDTPLFVYILVFFSYVTSFSVLILIPFDVYLSLGGQGDPSVLYTLWRALYWVIFALCWVVLPVTQTFFLVGEFSVLSRFREAVLIQLRSAFVLAGIGVAFIIYLALVKKLES